MMLNINDTMSHQYCTSLMPYSISAAIHLWRPLWTNVVCYCYRSHLTANTTPIILNQWRLLLVPPTINVASFWWLIPSTLRRHHIHTCDVDVESCQYSQELPRQISYKMMSPPTNVAPHQRCIISVLPHVNIDSCWYNFHLMIFHVDARCFLYLSSTEVQLSVEKRRRSSSNKA